MENKDFHLTEAKKCFNATWDLIDKKDKTKEERLEMIRLAQTSRHHWGVVGSPLEFERGDWLISKVYALEGYGELALEHALICLKVCLENDIADFDICFAYEAIANAYKALGDMKKVKEFKEKAYKGLDFIKDKGDRDYTKSEIDKI